MRGGKCTAAHAPFEAGVRDGLIRRPDGKMTERVNEVVVGGPGAVWHDGYTRLYHGHTTVTPRFQVGEKGASVWTRTGAPRPPILRSSSFPPVEEDDKCAPRAPCHARHSMEQARRVHGRVALGAA